jgi:hypothetical protein
MSTLLWFRTKNIFQLFVTLAAFAPLMTSDAAEPSNGISKLMKTPATVFDVFLFRLYEQSKCRVMNVTEAFARMITMQVGF